MAPHPVFSPSSTALITGAASGIGLAIAQLCARHGMKLALVDINTQNLATVPASLEGPENKPVDHETYAADVSKGEDWQDLKKKVDERFGDVHFLVLNAGISMPSGFDDVEAYRKIFATNFFGPLHGLQTFLPSLTSTSTSTTTSSSIPPHPRAILLTGSKQGITNPPGNPAYNSSKSALKTLAEQLSLSLSTSAPHISVHLLVPGWTFTGLTGGGRTVLKEKPEGAWTPEQVATYLEEGMSRGEFYVICPDNDVSEEEDRRRILWGAGDLVERRPPLTRWREEWRERAKEGMGRLEVPRGRAGDGEKE